MSFEALAQSPSSEPTLSPRDSWIGDQNRLAWRLLEKAAVAPDKGSIGANLVICPYGMMQTIAMAGEGADGETAKELTTHLHHRLKPGQIASALAALDPRRPASRYSLGILVEEHPDGGVQVTEVEPDSPAVQLGIEKDDVILELDGWPVNSPEIFAKMMARPVRIAELKWFSSDKQKQVRKTVALQRAGVVARTAGVTFEEFRGAWLSEELSVSPEFLKSMNEGFQAKLSAASFGRDPEGFRKQANTQVREQFKGMEIPDILPTGTVDREIKFILANLSVLKAKWSVPFDRRSTQLDGTFRMENGAVINQVAFMKRRARLDCRRSSRSIAIELPLENSPLAVDLVIPAQDQTLLDAVADLRQASESKEGLVFRAAMATVAIPRINVQISKDFANDIAALGWPSAFTNQANFSGISADGGVKLSRVLQTTWLKMDERGIEATAATAVQGRALSDFQPEIVFTADRPFLLLIRDREHGAIVFAAVIRDPLSNHDVSKAPKS